MTHRLHQRRYRELRRKYIERQRENGIRDLWPKVQDKTVTPEEKRLYAELAEFGSLKLYFEEPGIKEMLETVWAGDRAIQDLAQRGVSMSDEQRRDLMVAFVRQGFDMFGKARREGNESN